MTLGLIILLGMIGFISLTAMAIFRVGIFKNREKHYGYWTGECGGTDF